MWSVIKSTVLGFFSSNTLFVYIGVAVALLSTFGYMYYTKQQLQNKVDIQTITIASKDAKINSLGVKLQETITKSNAKANEYKSNLAELETQRRIEEERQLARIGNVKKLAGQIKQLESQVEEKYNEETVNPYLTHAFSILRAETGGDTDASKD